MVLSQKTVQMMHNNTRPDDAQLTFTTLGWMMWNHMLSTLGCGACMAAYDGSPFAPSPSTIWAIAERFKITILGLSPRYLQSLETNGYVPNKEFDLRHVRQIQLAGSVLKPELYDCESGRGFAMRFRFRERCEPHGGSTCVQTLTAQTFSGMRDYIHKDVWVNNGTGGTDVSQETVFLLALKALS